MEAEEPATVRLVHRTTTFAFRKGSITSCKPTGRHPSAAVPTARAERNVLEGHRSRRSRRDL